MLNKSEKKDKYTMISLVCGILREKKKIDAENRVVIAKVAWGWVKQRVQKVQISYKLSHGNAMYSMMTTVNNTTSLIWMLLRE